MLRLEETKTEGELQLLLSIQLMDQATASWKQPTSEMYKLCVLDPQHHFYAQHLLLGNTTSYYKDSCQVLL